MALYEDDLSLAREIVLAFEAEGLLVELMTDEAELVRHARSGKVSILIIDRMIANRDSLEILESLRTSGDRLPVIVISSLATVDERIRGLKAGGDDYLVKPFAMAELIARVEALRRRASDDRRTRIVVGSLELDLIARTVRRGPRDIALLPREFALLEYLMRHAGHAVSRAMLLEDVWHYRAPVQTNVVDVHIGNLRRKVDAEGEPQLITSVRGLGFRLAADGETPS